MNREECVDIWSNLDWSSFDAERQQIAISQYRLWWEQHDNPEAYDTLGEWVCGHSSRFHLTEDDFHAAFYLLLGADGILDSDEVRDWAHEYLCDSDVSEWTSIECADLMNGVQP